MYLEEDRICCYHFCFWCRCLYRLRNHIIKLILMILYFAHLTFEQAPPSLLLPSVTHNRWVTWTRHSSLPFVSLGTPFISFSLSGKLCMRIRVRHLFFHFFVLFFQKRMTFKTYCSSFLVSTPHWTGSGLTAGALGLWRGHISGAELVIFIPPSCFHHNINCISKLFSQTYK